MLSEKKQELQVAALENGTVIDHIPSERLFTVVSLLGLEHAGSNITISPTSRQKEAGRKEASSRLPTSSSATKR